MLITCPKCHQICETEAEVTVGQHVVCPFCNVKFSYNIPIRRLPRWLKPFFVGFGLALVFFVLLICVVTFQALQEPHVQVMQKRGKDRAVADVKEQAAAAIVGQMEGCRYYCKVIEGRQRIGSVFELQPLCREYLVKRWKLSGRDIGGIDQWYNLGEESELDYDAEDTPVTKALRIGRAIGCHFALVKVGLYNVDNLPPNAYSYLMLNMRYNYKTCKSIDEAQAKLRKFYAKEARDILP